MVGNSCRKVGIIFIDREGVRVDGKYCIVNCVAQIAVFILRGCLFIKFIFHGSSDLFYHHSFRDTGMKNCDN